ncbi:MAG TPA: IPT/TIG domain-containing protein, partial [Caldilineaceae bacterium]|nr:IPT/TIG domain-containing protein [Caldilineaceae bacterium]
TAFAVANPQATLESLLPASAQEGAAAHTLVLKGKNFVGGSQLMWNGSARNTTFISTGELRTQLTAADLATAGSATVKVTNPAPGGGESANQLSFTITAPGQNPQPAIDYITPQSVAAEVTEFTLTVVGVNFVQGAVVRYNGVNRPTTFVDSSHLTAQIGATEVLAALAAQDPDVVTAAAVDANQPAGVTVQNPPPGGGTSNAVLFTVLEAGQNPTPSLTALQPAAIIEQGPSSGGLTVQVQGENFLESAQAYWNGAPRTTKFVSESQLTVTLLGSDIAFAGSGSLTVENPAPGGGASNSLVFIVNAIPLNPIPTITQLTPDHILGQGLTTPPAIDVLGSNFLPSAGVYWDGVLRPTKFIDSSHLQFTLTMTDVVSAEVGAITVINPPPGGGASQEQAFIVFGYGIYLPTVMR